MKHWTTCTFVEKIQTKNKEDYAFEAKILNVDEGEEWSSYSRNGNSYNVEATIRALDKAINNGGIPIMWDHIYGTEDADLLGRALEYEIREDGIYVIGKLNGRKQRVKDEIVPGYCNHISLNVDADEAGRTDLGVLAVPKDFYEISFVPVPGFSECTLNKLELIEKLDNRINKANRKNDKDDWLRNHLTDEEYDSLDEETKEVVKSVIKKHLYVI